MFNQQPFIQFVASVDEARVTPTNPNSFCVAINRGKNEMYFKQMLPDGTLIFETYKKIETKEPKDVIQDVLGRLEALEKKMNMEVREI